MREIQRESDLLARAQSAGRYVDPHDMMCESNKAALSKSLDDSRDEWWGEVAQRWVGL